jgi:hypothetical protein
MGIERIRKPGFSQGFGKEGISKVSRDLREYTKSTNVRLVIGFLALVFLVGDGLIFLFYGKEAGIFGLVCMFGALVPVLLIIIFLLIADKVVKKNK